LANRPVRGATFGYGDAHSTEEQHMVTRFGAAAGLALCLVLAAPAHAASQAESELKAEIDALLNNLESGTDGLLKWDGADRIDIRPDGDGAVAEISNARISIDPNEPAPSRLTFDRVEIRRSPAPDNAVALTIVFPQEAVVRAASGEEIRLALKDATASALLDAQSGRTREADIAIAGARLEDGETGDWLSFGPLSLSSRLVSTADGGWTTPFEVEIQAIEFFLAEAPVAGAIERIAYAGRASGPDFAELNRVRDRIDALPQQEDMPAAAQRDAWAELLPSLSSLFSLIEGETAIDRVAVRAPTGEPVFAFDEAGIRLALTGLSGDAAALRVTLTHDGLSLAPGLVDEAMVPRRVVVDFGLEEVATGPLRTMLDALRKLWDETGGAGQVLAQAQILGAAAMLQPVFRIYDLAVDTPDVGLAASASATGSPLTPKGYRASGDVALRGFDALPGLLGPAPMAEYLPLLKEIGVAATAEDGTPQTKFHLASAPPKWLTINDSDVSAWFADDATGPGRALRPADPPMSGADVRAVQRALAAAKVAAPQTGIYDAGTAVAVARFQRQSGLNVDGVADAATRAKLNIQAEPAQPGRRR
jgi:hypothetical protein